MSSHVVGGVLSDELRGELLKKPDLTLQTAHDCCRTLEAAELQKYKFNTPTVAGCERSLHPLRKVKVQEKTPARNCKFVVTSTHLLSHLAAQLLERNATSVRRKDTLHKCAKN